jgi:restriction system protein
LYYLIPFLKRKRIRRATDLWRIEHAEWEDALSEIEAQNNDRYAEHEKSMQEWSEREQAFKASQVELNSRLKELQQRHLDKDPDAIVEFTDLILSRSEYPDCFPKNWEIGFDGATGVMVVDYDLPDVAQLPKFGAVRYIQARNAFENILLKDKERDDLFEGAVYQTCLRTIDEIFRSDLSGAIQSVTFNGYADFVDKANGKPARACIASLQTTKAAVENIDLNVVDPKACFRALKGVGSSKLAGMAAVVPILKLNRADKRFVPAREVMTDLDEGVNIAAIPWEDFEHLVCELFEKEFPSLEAK